jgi:hypothetical protein
LGKAAKLRLACPVPSRPNFTLSETTFPSLSRATTFSRAPLSRSSIPLASSGTTSL